MARPVRNPYAVLGVDPHASPEEIRAAFRRLAAQHHPDRNPDDADAAERFKEINLAHQILGDPDKRAAFDRWGASAFTPGGNRGPGAGFVDLGAVEGMFGDFLEAIGMRTADRGDVRQRVKLSLVDAALGCTREVSYTRVDLCTHCGGSGAAAGTATETCSTCEGRGRIRQAQPFLPVTLERTCTRCHGTGRLARYPCRDCHGRGIAPSQHRLAVTIPAGIESGASRIVEGAGSRPRRDRPPGHLEVVVEVEPHPFFERAGHDLRCKVPVTFIQASLGAEIEVPTLEGKAKLRVPAGTQPGSVLRLRGKGVPHRSRPGRGDQLVELSVEVPVVLSERARELIAELGAELGQDSSPQRQSFLDRVRGWFG